MTEEWKNIVVNQSKVVVIQCIWHNDIKKVPNGTFKSITSIT